MWWTNWWTNPWWLLALILLVPVIGLSGFSFNYRKQTDPLITLEKAAPPKHYLLKRLTVLRVAAIVAIIFGLAGTSILIPTWNRQLVILLDVSASVGEVSAADSRHAALKIIAALKPWDRTAVVIFAGQPTVLTPLVKPEDALIILESALLKSPFPEQTDLQAALRAAYQLLRDRRGNRSILLFSDGHSNSGGTVSGVITAIRDSGILIYSIPVGITGNGPVARELKLPELVHPGEKIQAQWKVAANQTQMIIVGVKLDGRLIYRIPTRITKGENTIPLVLTSQTDGIHRVEVAAETVDGNTISQSVSGGLLQISSPARILVVHGDASPALSQALRIQGIQVSEQGASQFPDTIQALDGYAAIVLDNVPALYLNENQQNLLQSYVAGGGGLLVIGGDASLGRGEYYGTGLEDLLPVRTDTRQRILFPRSEILFVIDHSGSMAEMVGNTSKQFAAMQWVAAALNELNPQDEVGILTFDAESTWLCRFTPVNRRKEIMDRLSTMSVGGGTNIAGVIQEVIREFSVPEPIGRHVIILTDGFDNTTDSSNNQDVPDIFKKLSLKLKELRVTITTIGIGDQINEPLLRDLAYWGEGQFYRANGDQISRVIQTEIVRITRDLIQEGRFNPAIRTKAANLSGLEDNLPPIKGYLLTKPKQLATVYLETGKSDPLLAGWRYGNGQVTVFTSDSGRRWLTPWTGMPVYNRFWSQLIRSMERADISQGLRASVNVEAGSAQISIEAIDSGHRLRSGLSLIGYTGNGPDQFTFHLRETAMGHYEASVPLVGSGIQQFDIYEQQGNERTICWVWNPPGAELLTLGPDTAFLGQLSNATGGEILKLTHPKLPRLNWPAWTPLNLQNWLVIIALLLFLVELGYRSTSLGQLATAWVIIASWWTAQVRKAEIVRDARSNGHTPTSSEPQNMSDAHHRYLADQARQYWEDRQDK